MHQNLIANRGAGVKPNPLNCPLFIPETVLSKSITKFVFTELICRPAGATSSSVIVTV